MRPTTTMLIASALLATGAAAAAAGAAPSGGAAIAATDRGDAGAIHLRRGGDDDRDREVRRGGTCTGSSRSKIKVKEEDAGRLEVEFEVDQNVNGRRWGVVLRKNGRVVVRRAARTRAPSGSFTVRALLADGAGADTVSGVARRVRGGERCTARATL